MKILIVTYTYPPALSVNGFRPFHFAKGLHHAGWDVWVLTRHFKGTEFFEDYSKPNSTPFATASENGVTVYRTPFENTWFKYFDFTWIQKTGLWRFIYFIQLLFGRTTQESYNKWFKPYLQYILAEHQFDVMLVESGPTNLVRIVARLAAKYAIPMAIDFRDAYYHEMYLKNQKTLPLSKKIKIGLEKFYLRKSIHQADLLISLSTTLLDILEAPLHCRLVLVNGYDEEAWSRMIPIIHTTTFKITIAGTLYNKSFLTPFLQSLKIFLDHNLPHVEVVFLAPGAESVIARIKNILHHPEVKIIPKRLSYQDSLHEMNNAQVLAYHGWAGYRGYPSAKIYEYIRAAKSILVVPADHDVIDRLLIETQTGKSFDQPVDAANQLVIWYNEWKHHGTTNIAPNTSAIQQYARQKQNLGLIQALNQMILTRSDHS